MRKPRSSHPRSAVLVRAAASVCAAAGLWAAGPPDARAESGTETLQTSAEAWYTMTGAPNPVDTVCVLVGQCPDEADAPDPNPYPENTLHVSIDAGHESAQTYVAFDLSALPQDAVVKGGEIRLPIADQAAGSVEAATAKLQLCLVRSRFEEVEGSIDEPPMVDCSTPVPVAVEEKDGVLTATAPLDAVADQWEGESQASLAVMPTEDAASNTETWHVAFHGRDREAEGAKPITASFEYDVPEEEEEPEPEDEETEYFDTGGGDDFDFDIPTAFPGDIDGGAEPPVTDLGDPGTFEEAASDGELVYRRFAYPFVFVLPLLLFGAAWYFGWAFNAASLPPRRAVGARR